MADIINQIKAGFFDSVNRDRLYSADDMNRPYRRIINEGIFTTPEGTASSDFEVRGNNNRSVVVLPGEGLLGGRWITNESTITIIVPENPSLQPRIDSVFIRVDNRLSGRDASIVLKSGAPGTGEPPTASTLADVFEMRIANITVEPNTTMMDNLSIDDLRGGYEAPWITLGVPPFELPIATNETLGLVQGTSTPTNVQPPTEDGFIQIQEQGRMFLYGYNNLATREWVMSVINSTVQPQITALNTSVTGVATQLAETSSWLSGFTQRGTFVPSLRLGSVAINGSYTTRVGNFTRVGNLVQFSVHVVMSWMQGQLNTANANNSGTDTLTVLGLPFPFRSAANGGNAQNFNAVNLSVRLGSNSGTAQRARTGLIGTSSNGNNRINIRQTNVRMSNVRSGSASEGTLTNNFSFALLSAVSGLGFRISGVYEVAGAVPDPPEIYIPEFDTED